MKQKIVYCCEVCGKEFPGDEIAAQEHEMSHYSLKVPEYLEWQYLRRKSLDRHKWHPSWSVEKAFKEAYDGMKKLQDFEDQHELTPNIRQPLDV